MNSRRPQRSRVGIARRKASSFAFHHHPPRPEILPSSSAGCEHGLRYQTYLKMIIHEALRNSEAAEILWPPEERSLCRSWRGDLAGRQGISGSLIYWNRKSFKCTNRRLTLGPYLPFALAANRPQVHSGHDMKAIQIHETGGQRFSSWPICPSPLRDQGKC